MQILSPVRDLRGRVEQAKMARRLAWGPGRARGVVPYLQPRAHKCILTDASESQARRVHEGLSHIALARERTYPTLRDAQARALDNARHIRSTRVHT